MVRLLKVLKVGDSINTAGNVFENSLTATRHSD